MKTCRDCKRFIGLFRVESKDQNGNPVGAGHMTEEKIMITVTRCCDNCKKLLEVFEWEKNKKIICLECLKKCLKNV